MSSRSLGKDDWAELAPTDAEMKLARKIVKAVLDDGTPSRHSVDGPLTKDGMHCFQLFDVICLLREGNTKRRTAQIRRSQREWERRRGATE